jgi:hypothetical protein
MPAFFMLEGTMSKMQDTNFDWHAEVGNREMRGTAVNAIERDSRKVGAVDLMNRDPLAGTAKEK